MKTKTMKDILEILNKVSYGTKPFEELPEPEQMMIASKLQLKKLIELGHITDEKKADKWLELIELVYEWALDEEFSYKHDLKFYNDGSVLIQSYHGDYEVEFEVDYIDGKLFLNGEDVVDLDFTKHDYSFSIVGLMNVIEFNIAIKS